MIDQAFLEEPRICMGLLKRNRQVLRQSKEDEANAFRRSSLTGQEKGLERIGKE